MTRITKLGLAIMLFAIMVVLTAPLETGFTPWKAILYVIGLSGALCFIIPNDKKS
jgi:hypothetical protein